MEIGFHNKEKPLAWMLFSICSLLLHHWGMKKTSPATLPD
jgi:hypothetical protein